MMQACRQQFNRTFECNALLRRQAPASSRLFGSLSRIQPSLQSSEEVESCSILRHSRSETLLRGWSRVGNVAHQSARASHAAATQFSLMEPDAPRPELVDTFGRRHTYLRMSLTERCNLRCTYCMPDAGVPLTPSPSLLTTDEIIRLASIFVSRGVTKVRLTGGEPFIRPDMMDIAHAIGHHPGIETLAITTNGLVLKRHVPALLAARVSALNISLDTLVAPKFTLITRRNGHGNVLDGLFAALDAGFDAVKLNVVVMKGVNDDELGPFCDLTRDHPIDVRFIEFMPFDGNRWSDRRFISYADMLKIIGEHCGSLERATDTQNDTCKHFRIPDAPGRIGFITSMTNHFCGTCNRLRVTADGNIKVCLFGSDEMSLRDAMRSGATDDEVGKTIATALAGKHFSLGGNRDMYDIAKSENRSMIKIGG
jgi:molybdenum cofactor biosynthesis protein A